VGLQPGPERAHAEGPAALDPAYRLFQVCECRKAALPYNALVADWPEIQKRKAAFVATGGASREPELPGMVA
jgi:hypothetical protein